MKRLKVLLLGANGQVGWELQRSLLTLGDLIALNHSGTTELCGDISNFSGIRKTIRKIQPDIIVNAAAYTAVDKAESQPFIAEQINALGPKVLAEEAKTLNALLVHYSTEYVFDGSGDKPKQETEATNPLSIYGATKLAGELAIQKMGCRYLIFRTSWVYSSRGSNFAKTMLKVAQHREKLTVVSDQYGAPTGADLLADVTVHAIRSSLKTPELLGLYHLTAAGVTNWHEYASYIIVCAINKKMPLELKEIEPVKTKDYPTHANRPLNSRLNTDKFTSKFKIVIPNWKIGVERMIKEIT